uniref:Uncharacterized protein n=1 Tax=Ditylenchus dipsaci TaxID=166011 RepID=A0A915CYF5_9BILA
MKINNRFEALLLSITTVSIALQLYVIFLVIYASPPAMKAYRFFIITYTLYDLLFSFGIGFLIEPQLPSPAMSYIKAVHSNSFCSSASYCSNDRLDVELRF